MSGTGQGADELPAARGVKRRPRVLISVMTRAGSRESDDRWMPFRRVRLAAAVASAGLALGVIATFGAAKAHANYTVTECSNNAAPDAAVTAGGAFSISHLNQCGAAGWGLRLEAEYQSGAGRMEGVEFLRLARDQVRDLDRPGSLPNGWRLRPDDQRRRRRTGLRIGRFGRAQPVGVAGPEQHHHFTIATHVLRWRGLLQRKLRLRVHGRLHRGGAGFPPAQRQWPAGNCSTAAWSAAYRRCKRAPPTSAAVRARSASTSTGCTPKGIDFCPPIARCATRP